MDKPFPAPLKLRVVEGGSIRTGIAIGAIVYASLLSGCASRPAAGEGVHVYDLGQTEQTTASTRLPPLKVLALSGPRNLDSTAFVYRLQYADAQRIASYANSRWSMSPSQLLTQRLRDALSAHGTVLSGTDLAGAPLLRVELTDFEQVFDRPGGSHAVVSIRATVSDHARLIGQRVFSSMPPAPTADAAGGAKALSGASDDVVGQLIDWLGSLALPAPPSVR